MGAWSLDAFGNDDACDWAAELDGAKDLTPIKTAIDAVIEAGEEYLEAPDATAAIAAIEVLARVMGRWGVRDSYTEDVDRWAESVGVKPSPKLIASAASALDRILGDQSELNELWRDSDEYDAWVASVKELKSRIA